MAKRKFGAALAKCVEAVRVLAGFIANRPFVFTAIFTNKLNSTRLWAGDMLRELLPICSASESLRPVSSKLLK